MAAEAPSTNLNALDPPALLEHLAERKISLSAARGGRLGLEFAVSDLRREDLEIIRRQKEGLIAALAARGPWRPLSSGEGAFYRESVRRPASGGANVAFAIHIRSEVDGTRLRSALQDVLARHPMLRARYRWTGAEPERTAVAADLDFFENDIGPVADVELVDILRARASGAFDLARGKVFRVHWIRRHRADSVLMLVAHHAVTDGLSMAILVNDVRLAYAGPLPAASASSQASYDRFVEDERAYLASAQADSDWTYWRGVLAGAPLAIEFRSQTGEVEQHRHGRSAPCAVPGAWPCSALLAAWVSVLARNAGVDDFVLGTPVSGRAGSRFRSVVGNFMNLIPLRVRLSAGTTFAQLISSLREQIAAARLHGRLPFPEMAARLRKEGARGLAAVAPVGFTLQRAHGALVGRARKVDRGTPIEFGGLMIEPLGLPILETTFDVALELYAFGKRTNGYVKARTDRLSSDTVHALASAYPVALAALVATPDEPIVSVIQDHGLLVAGRSEERIHEPHAMGLFSAAERRLAAVWAQLGVPPSHPDQSFFDAGGHSLLATQLIGLIEQEYRVAISLRDVFEAPTLAALTSILQARPSGR